MLMSGNHLYLRKMHRRKTLILAFVDFLYDKGIYFQQEGIFCMINTNNKKGVKHNTSIVSNSTLITNTNDRIGLNHIKHSVD